MVYHHECTWQPHSDGSEQKWAFSSLLRKVILPLDSTAAALKTEIRDVNTQQRSLSDTNILYFSSHRVCDVGNEKRVVWHNNIFRGYFWLALKVDLLMFSFPLLFWGGSCWVARLLLSLEKSIISVLKSSKLNHFSALEKIMMLINT